MGDLPLNFGGLTPADFFELFLEIKAYFHCFIVAKTRGKTMKNIVFRIQNNGKTIPLTTVCIWENGLDTSKRSERRKEYFGI